MSNSASFTSGISGRYATALFELARDAKALDAVEGDLGALSAALAVSDDLQALISSPIYSRDVQAQAIGAVAKAMKLSKLTASTLGLMASKRRLFVLPQTLAAVQGLIAEARGEVTAEVTVARKLSKEQSDALAKALKSAIGKDVIIKTEVDDRLIGGMIVKLGSRMIDTSIRAKLSKLQNTMKEVG